MLFVLFFQIQWNQNDGNCGVCGDNWLDPEPRNHEDYGMYDNNYITGTYMEGQLIDVQVTSSLYDVARILYIIQEHFVLLMLR